MIRLGSPFSLEFYQRFVRDNLDDPNRLRQNWRWIWGNPNFYIKMTDEQGNRVVGYGDLNTMTRAIEEAVPAFTGNTRQAGIIESGSDDREQAGWITIRTVHIPGGDYAGRAWVGANPGSIELNRAYLCNEEWRPGTLAHEIGHALGFWHVVGNHIMSINKYQFRSCDDNSISYEERYHAWIAYQRPRGNTDPDRDPTEASLFTPAATQGPVVYCFR